MDAAGRANEERAIPPRAGVLPYLALIGACALGALIPWHDHGWQIVLVSLAGILVVGGIVLGGIILFVAAAMNSYASNK